MIRLSQDWYDIAAAVAGSGRANESAARVKRVATKSGTGCRMHGATSDAVESGNLSSMGVSSLNSPAGRMIGGDFFGGGDAA